MNEEQIIERLYRFFGNYDYKLHNVFIYQWESDFFAISSSGYTVEVEVKISKSDFKHDFKKSQKHKILRNGIKGLVTVPGVETNYINDNGKFYRSEYRSSSITVVKPFVPNKFYYCCPEELIYKQDVPDYAGLLYVVAKGDPEDPYYDIKEVKTPKFINKNKPDISKILLEKFYYISIKQAIEIRQLRNKINELNQYYQEHEEYVDTYDVKSKSIINTPYYEQSLFNQKL